jgi:hypothetical protein
MGMLGFIGRETRLGARARARMPVKARINNGGFHLPPRRVNKTSNTFRVYLSLLAAVAWLVPSVPHGVGGDAPMPRLTLLALTVNWLLLCSSTMEAWNQYDLTYSNLFQVAFFKMKNIY